MAHCKDCDHPLTTDEMTDIRNEGFCGSCLDESFTDPWMEYAFACEDAYTECCPYPPKPSLPPVTIEDEVYIDLLELPSTVNVVPNGLGGLSFFF